MRDITNEDLDLARVIAAKFATKHYRRYELDELTDEALFQLAIAAQRYDATQSTWKKFLVWFVYSRLLDFQRAQHKVRSHGRGVFLVSLENQRREEPGLSVETVIGEIDIAPEVAARLDLDAFLKRLNTRERFIIDNRLRGLSMNHIATRLGVTPSRVSQIFTDIAKRARVELAA